MSAILRYLNSIPLSFDMSVPSVHKALILREKGGDLIVETIETYAPKRGEVLVRIEAAGLNPADWKVREYGFTIGNFPAVLGLDGAGEVVGLGEDVTTLKIGDHVCVLFFFELSSFPKFLTIIWYSIYTGWLQSPSLGTFQQYGIAPAEFVAKVENRRIVYLPVLINCLFVDPSQPLV